MLAELPEKGAVVVANREPHGASSSFLFSYYTGFRERLPDRKKKKRAFQRTEGAQGFAGQQGLPSSAAAKSKERMRSYSSSVILRIVPCLKPYGNENSASARRKFASRRLSATKGT